MSHLKNVFVGTIAAAVLAVTSSANAAIVTATAKFAEGSPPTADLTLDALGVSATITDVGVGGDGSSTLNDGALAAAGTTSTLIEPADSVTYTFDTTVNTDGYDITEIATYAGWNTSAGGRSNQGYEIELTFVDTTTATLLGPATYEPNGSPEGFWTSVVHTNSGGGVLDNGSGVIATGVKAITWKSFDAANPGGVVVYREFDVVGVATIIPEPTAFVLLGLCLLASIGLSRRREKWMA